MCMTKGACVAKGGGHAWRKGGMRGERGGMGGEAEGSCVAGEMATAVDVTHPTGMHSCSFGFLQMAREADIRTR